MPRVPASCKSVRRGFGNHIKLRHWQVRLSGKALHHFVKPWHLLARYWPRTAGEQSDLVRKEIGESIRADRNSQAQGHLISPAKILAHQHPQEWQDYQQKSRTNTSH